MFGYDPQKLDYVAGRFREEAGMATGTRSVGRVMRAGTDRTVHWWRRAVSYVLRIVLPCSLLSQLIGTVFFGRSIPIDDARWLIYAFAFIVVVVSFAVTANSGQSAPHRLLHLQVYDSTGAPASRKQLLLRDVAHLIDFGSLGLGFVWPLWDKRRQTFADKIANTQVRKLPTSQIGS